MISQKITLSLIQYNFSNYFQRQNKSNNKLNSYDCPAEIPAAAVPVKSNLDEDNTSQLQELKEPQQEDDNSDYEVEYSDGTKYTGKMRCNKRNGVGRLVNEKGVVMYEGNWVCDLMHGVGKQYIPDEYTYTGEFFEGMKHGKGILRSCDDSLEYNGMWEYDLKSGEGMYSL